MHNSHALEHLENAVMRGSEWCRWIQDWPSINVSFIALLTIALIFCYLHKFCVFLFGLVTFFCGNFWFFFFTFTRSGLWVRWVLGSESLFLIRILDMEIWGPFYIFRGYLGRKLGLIMGIISTILGVFGFGIGITIGIVIGYFMFIYSQPTDVKVRFPTFRGLQLVSWRIVCLCCVYCLFLLIGTVDTNYYW